MIISTQSIMGQNTSDCGFSIAGTIINQFENPIIGQVISYQYQIYRNDRPRIEEITTNNNGEFKICLFQSPYNLKITIQRPNHDEYVTELSKTRKTNNVDLGTIVLKRAERLQTPVPTDIYHSSLLEVTGQQTPAKALHFLSPVFNSTTQPISDGSAHFDPTDIRGLGSSRMLVLVNGRRKNTSSFIHVNDVPNKSEVGVDLLTIPMVAIKQVRIERQESTTLFGSDAIGGIIDFELKEYQKEAEINFLSGVNPENGDGFNTRLDFFKSYKIRNTGFLSLSYEFYQQKETNRANNPGYDSLYLPPTSLDYPIWQDWVAENPDLRMKIGDPNLIKNNFFYNSKLPISSEADDFLYSFGGLTYRQTQSYANYRAPYWVKEDFDIFTENNIYNGFLPTFESDNRDHFFVFGINGRTIIADTIQVAYDLSQTVAGDKTNFFVDESINPSLGVNSPTFFAVGGSQSNSNNTRLDIEVTFTKDFRINVGGDFRSESYSLLQGEEKSYTGSGTISYPGTSPSNSVNAARYNYGAFLQILYSDERFDLDISGRYERYYRDENDILPWKVSALFRVVDKDDLKLIIRGSASRGFRAPALQQLYFGRAQTFATGPTVFNRGLFNSQSAVIRQLGIEPLSNEDSNTFSIGAALNAQPNKSTSLSFVADYYSIIINDRIILSSTLNPLDSSSLIRSILNNNNISTMNFFINAVDTKIAGIDIGFKYKRFRDPSERRKSFEFSISSNIVIENTILDKINNSDIIEEANLDIFDRKEQSRMLYARPNSKTIATLGYQEVQRFGVFLNASYFGQVKWQHPTDPLNDQIFSGKLYLSLHGNLAIKKASSFSLTINNILNTYPDPISSGSDTQTNVGGRFKYYREVNQFGYNGISIVAGFNFNLN